MGIPRAKSARFPDSERILDFRKCLLNWYKERGRDFPWRKKSTTKYKYIVAEILLQRTRVETISNFFPKFVSEFPSWKKLSLATLPRLQFYLKPIGLWRRRAHSVRELAKEMNRRNGRFPTSNEKIQSLPGIGQYIANAVQLFCHKKPRPLLDVNMARLLERVFGPRKLSDIRYDPYLQELSGKIVNCKNSEIVNWAILDFASIICKGRNPDCAMCPFNTDCQYFLKISKKVHTTGAQPKMLAHFGHA